MCVLQELSSISKTSCQAVVDVGAANVQWVHSYVTADKCVHCCCASRRALCTAILSCISAACHACLHDATWHAMAQRADTIKYHASSQHKQQDVCAATVSACMYAEHVVSMWGRMKPAAMLSCVMFMMLGTPAVQLFGSYCGCRGPSCIIVCCLFRLLHIMVMQDILCVPCQRRGCHSQAC